MCIDRYSKIMGKEINEQISLILALLFYLISDPYVLAPRMQSSVYLSEYYLQYTNGKIISSIRTDTSKEYLSHDYVCRYRGNNWGFLNNYYISSDGRALNILN